MKISVIMSVYNGSNSFIKKSITSILEQSYQNLEFIIINDGSNKQISNLLQDFQKKDNRIKLFTNSQNIGLTRSLNIGIKHATGNFIARMDSDDIASPLRLEKQLKYIQKEQLDLIGCDATIINMQGNTVGEITRKLPQNIQQRLLLGNFLIHSTFFGTKKVFSELYNENFVRAQDYEFLLRIVSLKYKIGYLSENLLQYRMNPNGISTKDAKTQELSAIRARILALQKYHYSPLYAILLINPLISFLVPKRFKDLIYKGF